jgi:hypothetical protein
MLDRILDTLQRSTPMRSIVIEKATSKLIKCQPIASWIHVTSCGKLALATLELSKSFRMVR